MLTFIYILFIVQQTVSMQEDGEPCTDVFKTRGTCRLIFECRTSGSNNDKKRNLEICSWSGLTPIICCIEYKESSTLKPIYDSQALKEIHGLFMKLQKTALLTRPQGCQRSGISRAIRNAHKRIVENRDTRRPFGTRLDRIARYKPRLILVMGNERPIYRERDFGSGIAMTTAIGSIDNHFYPIYFLNWTMAYLEKNGYVTKVESKYYDAVEEFTYWNLSSCWTASFDYVALGQMPSSELIGGEPAARNRATYMALIGEKKNRNADIFWGCGGVLLSFNWVLTAAHCFLIFGFNPNVVRLGEYDLNEVEKGLYSNFPEDIEIGKTVFYPDFRVEQRYHDLVLFCLKRPAPRLSNFINPIQLPWNDVNNDYINQTLTLSGWGATEYMGPMINNLEEVNVTVFEPQFCDVNYADLPDYKSKWPDGLLTGNIICAGDVDGEKDSCMGDSGSPLVYAVDGKYTLAAIVSGGYGCGLKDYPGIYIPLNTQHYLQWIKNIVFS